MCVQRLDDSLNSAIRINFRISLRSSSMPEPRDPLLKVLTCDFQTHDSDTADGRLRLVDRSGGDGPDVPVSTRRRAGGAGHGRGWLTCRRNGGRSSLWMWDVGVARRRPPDPLVMILPQVHLRKPCYDFYFL